MLHSGGILTHSLRERLFILVFVPRFFKRFLPLQHLLDGFRAIDVVWVEIDDLALELWNPLFKIFDIKTSYKHVLKVKVLSVYWIHLFHEDLYVHFLIFTFRCFIFLTFGEALYFLFWPWLCTFSSILFRGTERRLDNLQQSVNRDPNMVVRNILDDRLEWVNLL